MQPNISLLAPLQESMVPTPSVASPVAGRVCLGCGCAFVSDYDAKLYCSRRCAKSAEKRRATARRARFVEFDCPYCGEIGARRLSRGLKVVTCGKRECVIAHKKNIKKRLDEYYSANEIKKTWPSVQKNKRTPEDECMCGRIKYATRHTCKECHNAISEAIRLSRSFLSGYCGQSTCAQCGIVYERTAKRQVCCSSKCHNKLKQNRYKKSGVLAQWTKRYRQKAKATDPLYKVKRSVRTRLREAMFGFRKNGTTFENLGYTPDQLREHLESLFVFGMGWHNYGTEWHIDHIKPVSHHVFKTEKDVYRCWKLSNLKPRYATNAIAARHGSFHEGNIEKGNRYAG